MSGYGSLVIGGFTFEITAMYFKDSRLHVVAERDGPVPAFDGEPITIFGVDGKGFAQGGHAKLPAVTGTEKVSFWLDLVLDSCT